MEEISSLPLFKISHAHPDPKRVMPALLNFSLNASKEPNVEVIASASFPVGVPPAFGASAFPEKCMVPVTATVVSYCRADGSCRCNKFFKRFIFIWCSGDSFIQVVNVSLVVLSMMYLHCGCVDMWFKCIVRIRQSW